MDKKVFRKYIRKRVRPKKKWYIGEIWAIICGYPAHVWHKLTDKNNPHIKFICGMRFDMRSPFQKTFYEELKSWEKKIK